MSLSLLFVALYIFYLFLSRMRSALVILLSSTLSSSFSYFSPSFSFSSSSVRTCTSRRQRETNRKDEKLDPKKEKTSLAIEVSDYDCFSSSPHELTPTSSLINRTFSILLLLEKERARKTIDRRSLEI